MHVVLHYVPTVNMWNVFEKIIQVGILKPLKGKGEADACGDNAGVITGLGWIMYISEVFFILFFPQSETHFNWQKAFRVSASKERKRLKCQVLMKLLEIAE